MRIVCTLPPLLKDCLVAVAVVVDRRNSRMLQL
jgi:hypothetical protein